MTCELAHPKSERMISDKAIPEGWIHAPLQELAFRIQYGYTASATHESKGPRFLRITDIQDGKVDWESVPTCEIDRDDLEKYALQPGDIVFARTGATTGKSFLIGPCPKNSIFASYLIRLQPASGVNSGFLSLFFQTPEYWQFISENVSGNAQPNCNATKLAALMVPLPPAAEQKRIVARVEQLLTCVSAARERLARIPTILKCFRQAVLAAACSGRLTAGWQKEDSDTGAALLTRIRQDRCTYWDGAHRKVKYPEPQHLDVTELPDLPEEWSWTALDQIVQEGRPIIYGIIKPGPHVPDGVPYVRINEMTDGGFVNPDGLRRADPARAAKFNRATLMSGDILVSKDGTIGRVSVVPPELEGGNITQHLVRVSPHHLMDRWYLVSAIRSQYAQKWLLSELKGVALQGVNVRDFRRLPIPVPPVAEQAEIVRRVNALFKLADVIEKRVAAATARAEKLTQAILAKAFRGELVPTEAELARREGHSYESASDLLTRIRAERTTEGSNHKVRKRNVGK